MLPEKYFCAGSNQILETIRVIRPITATILITDPLSPRLTACQQPSSALKTRKCYLRIGNYPGVSFTGVIATNLAKMQPTVIPGNDRSQLSGDNTTHNPRANYFLLNVEKIVNLFVSHIPAVIGIQNYFRMLI